jgi:SPP1 family predicted phage head-tail adaptor
MSLVAPNLHEKIVFRREEKLSDGGGGWMDNQYVDYYSCSAEIMPLSGRERNLAAQTENPRNYRVIIRNCASSRAIQNGDIIKWRDMALNITFIAYSGVKEPYLYIDCEQSHINSQRGA